MKTNFNVKNNSNDLRQNKIIKEKNMQKTNNKLPILKNKKLTRGQKAADFIAKWAGSWTFIAIFAIIIFLWATLNTIFVIFGVWDTYPFILLNLFLSCLAAIQAPVILMSQNRQSETDRQRMQYDYLVDRKAEREIKQIQIDLLEVKQVVLKQSTRSQTQKLRNEIKKIQEEVKKFELKTI